MSMTEEQKEAIKEGPNISGHPNFYSTIVHSPQWKDWEKVAHEYGFDWHESTECGFLSDKHFQAFMKWCKHNRA